MAPITATIDVARPPQQAYAYVTDPTRFSEWQQGVVDGRIEGDARHGVGDRCLTTRRIGFAERTASSEVTLIDPPDTWAISGIDGPIRATVTVRVNPLDGGRHSRVKIDVDFTGHGIGKLLVPLFVLPSARKEMPANLQRLKERLETTS
jgi:uncharacterized protein YndB with AHSA1/START domain